MDEKTDATSTDGNGITGNIARDAQSRLVIVPVTFEEACAFVTQYHRHHLPQHGHKFSIAVADEAGEIRGVACVGKPVSRVLDNGWCLEVTRVATDGCPNACSALYGGAWRAAKALGYRKLVTYILATEPGTSVRAAGWKCVAEVKGRSWNTPGCNRPRVDKHPLQNKLRFEVEV